VLVRWDNSTYSYDHSIPGYGGTNYNVPMDYTLQANAASGSTVPASNWLPLLTVSGNTFHSRQHVVDLSGAGWFRMLVTQADGDIYNYDAEFNLDVFDASAGCGDSWLFLGDSITAVVHRMDASPTVAQLIHTAHSAYYPSMEGAGIGAMTAAAPLGTASSYGGSVIIDYWLAQFPGKYVCLSYGTNGLQGNVTQSAIQGVYNNIVSLVNHVYAAGKIPCVSYVPWAPDTTIQSHAPVLNAMLDDLFDSDAQIVRGPDLFSVLSGHPEWFEDDLHPNGVGAAHMRQTWADALSPVYE